MWVCVSNLVIHTQNMSRVQAAGSTEVYVPEKKHNAKTNHRVNFVKIRIHRGLSAYLESPKTNSQTHAQKQPFRRPGIHRNNNKITSIEATTSQTCTPQRQQPNNRHKCNKKCIEATSSYLWNPRRHKCLQKCIDATFSYTQYPQRQKCKKKSIEATSSYTRYPQKHKCQKHA